MGHLDQLSVVITNFGRAGYLANACESVRLSGINNLIVTSVLPDLAVEQVVDKYRPEFLRHSVDNGCNESWLAGVKAAKTKYVTLLHDDDWFTSEFRTIATDCVTHLEQGVGFAVWSGKTITLASAWETLVNSDASEVVIPSLQDREGVVSSNGLQNKLALRDTPSLSPVVGMFRKDHLVDALEEAECNFQHEIFYTREKMMVGNDLLIWLRATSKYLRCYYTPRVGTVYRIHSGSETTSCNWGRLMSCYNSVRDYIHT